jgi:chemotaxis protein methyltransferase CheR
MSRRGAQLGIGASKPRMREFEFSHADFLALRAMLKSLAGIDLADCKEDMVYSRISRRVRSLGLSSFGHYRELLNSGDSSEITEFCNAMTTNLTAFFRESHHFDYLRDHILAPRMNAPRAARRIRIWSSGCSSGEEAYSIAMTVCETIPDRRGWDVKILATDVDSRMLAIAEQGSYTQDRLKCVGSQRLARFFRENSRGEDSIFTIAPDVAALVTFKQLNLMHDWPMSGPFDAIMCRNVVIYFDKDTQRQLFARMAQLQRRDDLLFLGHSETLFKVSTDYTLIGKTVYRRTET